MNAMRSIKSQNKTKISTHTPIRYRKIQTPKKDLTAFVDRPYQNEFRSGQFKNDIYFSMNRSFIASVYIKNLLLFNIPAILIHLFILGINSIGELATGESQQIATSRGAIELLIILYGVGTFLALHRIGDYMTYFTSNMMNSKATINQLMVRMIWNSQTPETDPEIQVLDAYRVRFAKHALFTSIKEFAMEQQLYERSQRSKNEQYRQQGAERYAKLDIESRREELFAAKEIADWKTETYGIPNEFDAWVQKYKHRAAPAVKTMIDQLQDL